MRSVLVVAHTGRDAITSMTSDAVRQLRKSGFEVRMLAGEAVDAGLSEVVQAANGADLADGAEIVLVFGGDGTFLRATEFARPAGVPLLGVNLGHVGFLAEVEPEALHGTIDAVIGRRYQVEERTTVDVEIVDGAAKNVIARDWALNEASLEKSSRERMLELAVAVDGRPLLRFGCDGILCATPTGSTAYAFSAGGPIVWPDVDALLVVPNAAHATFARPIVVAPSSLIEIDLLRVDHPGVLSCDGRRSVDVPPGAVVRVKRGKLPVRIARLHPWNFTHRLVTKFALPVRGFRDNASRIN